MDLYKAGHEELVKAALKIAKPNSPIAKMIGQASTDEVRGYLVMEQAMSGADERYRTEIFAELKRRGILDSRGRAGSTRPTRQQQFGDLPRPGSWGAYWAEQKRQQGK